MTQLILNLTYRQYKMRANYEVPASNDGADIELGMIHQN